MKLVRPKRSTLGAHFIGLGAVLTTVHGNMDGTLWSLGALLGLAFVVAGLVFAPRPDFKSFLLGEKLSVTVPVGIILLSALLGIFVHGQPKTDSFYFGYLVLTVLIFLYGTSVSRWILVWVLPIALLNIPSVVAGGITEPSMGGYGLTGNSGLAGTLLGLSLVVGLLFLKGKLKWFLLIPVVGLFFSGDHWTWLGLLVVVVVALAEKDFYGLFDKSGFPKLWIASVVVLLVVVGLLGLSLGFTEPLYGFGSSSGLPTQYGETNQTVYSTLGNRLPIDQEALVNTSFLGHGVQLDTTTESLNRYGGIVHSVPLMIWDDLGPLAALAWLFLMFRAIAKSKDLRYILVFILVVSLFSYWFWWTLGLGMFTWLLLGLAEEPITETIVKRNLLRMVERMKSEA